MDEEKTSDLVNFISNLMNPIIEQLKSLGATSKTIDSFLEGEEILDCPICNTFNLYELDFKRDEISDYSIYECNKCSSLYRRRWKDYL
jgi:uncharacterized C2H2 Zn-finger protein